jgi:hypothetical protein
VRVKEMIGPEIMEETAIRDSWWISKGPGAEAFFFFGLYSMA